MKLIDLINGNNSLKIATFEGEEYIVESINFVEKNVVIKNHKKFQQGIIEFDKICRWSIIKNKEEIMKMIEFDEFVKQTMENKDKFKFVAIVSIGEDEYPTMLIADIKNIIRTLAEVISANGWSNDVDILEVIFFNSFSEIKSNYIK